MAITYKSQGAGVSSQTSAISLQPACPATVDAGDILIAHVFWEGLSESPDTPSGWTLLSGPIDVQTVARHWVFGRIADGSEDGATVLFSLAPLSTDQRAARIYSFAGRVSGTITDCVTGFATTTHATDPQMPSVTTTKAGSLAVAMVCQNDNNSLAAATGESGGDWVEAVADYVAGLTPGLVLQAQTAAMASVGTISGGAVAAANDPSGVIAFEIRESGVTNYSLSIDTSAVDISMTAVGLRHDRVLAIDANAAAISQTNVGLYRQYPLVIDANAVPISQTDVSFAYARAIVIDAGAVPISQSDVGALYHRIFSVDASAVPISQTDVGLLHDRMLAVDTEVVSISTQNVGLLYARVMPLATEAVSIGATDVGLYRALMLTVDGNNVPISAADVDLVYTPLGGGNYTIVIDETNVSITAQSVGLFRGYTLVPDAASVPLKTKRHPAIVPDSSGNGRHGIIKGTPTEIASPWSGFGTTLEFDGVDADDNSEGVLGPIVPSSSPLTFEGRFKRNVTNRIEIIASWWDWGSNGATYSGMLVYLSDTDDNLHCDIYNQYTGSPSQAFQISDVGNVGVGEHTFAVEIIGTFIALYLDGTFIANRTITCGWPTVQTLKISAARVQMGRNPDFGPDPVPGNMAIDEIRASKVLRYGFASYTPTSTPFTTDSDTLLLWHFDESETAIDLRWDRRLNLEANAVQINALAVELLRQYTMSVQSASCDVTPSDVVLLYNRAIDLMPSNVPIGPSDISLMAQRIITILSADVPIVAHDVSFIKFVEQFFGHIVQSKSSGLSSAQIDSAVSSPKPTELGLAGRPTLSGLRAKTTASSRLGE